MNWWNYAGWFGLFALNAWSWFQVGRRRGERETRRLVRLALFGSSTRVPPPLSTFAPIATRHVDQRAILNDHLKRHIRGGRGN